MPQSQSVVFVVVADRSMILGVYRQEHMAHMHQRTVTGATVVEQPVLDDLPEQVWEQLGVDFDDEPTPVTMPFRKP